ncbi:MAG: glycosyltransferase family 1 protein [Candidatus Shapirobacteria bacterium]|jgi:glycosyltransferase involved in cell wall biosynthesis
MIIGIDINSIPYGTGVSNYTLNLVKNLIKIDKVNTYKLFFTSKGLSFPKSLEKLQSFPNVTIYYYKLPLRFFEIVWNTLHFFPIELFIGQCDIFHTSDWTHPPTRRAKTICTIHDLTPFINPEWHSHKIIVNHQTKMRHAATSAAHFICVSENTRSDLFKIFPQVDPAKTSVIYEAAENKYHQFNRLQPSVRHKKIALLKNHYELDNYFLAQGTREPRKNLHRLIEAFRQFCLRHPDTTAKLAIAGKYGWGEDVAKNDPNVRLLGYVKESDMVTLHAGAKALVYPSLYEGFGLPVVKSLKVGVPVITSNLSSLPEIARGAAILVDPYSVESISQALSQVYFDQSLRRHLIETGLQVARHYNWAKTARQTLKIYYRVASST